MNIGEIINWRFWKFMAVGAVGTLTSAIVLFAFTDWLKTWYMLSFLVGTVVGCVVNYKLNEKFVWR